jgi:hypothetical protein
MPFEFVPRSQTGSSEGAALLERVRNKRARISVVPPATIGVNMISGTISEAGARKKFLIPLKKTAQDIRSRMLSSR